MPTSNPRNISIKTHKMLWGRAASRCAFPECRRELVMERTAVDDASLVGEACHMVAKEAEGPRGNSPLSSKQRDEYDNLLLLCNLHHKVVDDQHHTYTVERLQRMKAEHEQWVWESLRGVSPVWNVPYRRNPLFSGREDVLNLLHDKLILNKASALTQPQAVSGLGGIGKTQIAVEYAYSYRDAYAAVFWVRAASTETLTLDYTNIAQLLQLPQKDEQDTSFVVAAVKRWLSEHTNWLLILDNADDLAIVYDFLPTENTGHVLLTTRAYATNKIAQRIEIQTMNKTEGSLLLLRCAKVLEGNEPIERATQEQRIQAEAITHELDGLPLALDQAGAYIEETECGLAGYLSLYRTRRKELLRLRGDVALDHPEPVATTWSLSFQQVEQNEPAAAEVLRLLAFLDPDAIPEEILVQENVDLGPILTPVVTDPFLWNNVMKELQKFSLIRRDVQEKLLSIHRLVQAVLRDKMDMETQQQWATRAVGAVNKVFPDEVDVTTWGQCKRYMPQAQACADLCEHFDFAFAEAARLLNQAATYYKDRAQYNNTESLLQRALAIRERVLGPQHPDTARSLNNLAVLYYIQGKYELAEPLYQRALAIRERVLEPHHPGTATSLNNLAYLYYAQGRYELAESLYQHTLAICEQVLGPRHLDTARSLNNLAILYSKQGKYGLAESLYQRTLAICEQVLGRHPYTASSLNNLATLYLEQGKYELAEPLLQRALNIFEQILGPQHPNTSQSLNNLAALYFEQGRYELAEPLFQRALNIFEQVLGPQHPDTITILNNYTTILKATHRTEQAIELEARFNAMRDVEEM